MDPHANEKPMLWCEQCKASGRVNQGYVSVSCDSCDGKGNLTVDKILKMRDSWARVQNDYRLFEWKQKKRLLENG